MHKRTYVDYSEASHEKQVAGRSFTVRYAVVDHFGDKVYYFEEREREHIVPERKAKSQGFLIWYLDKVPAILHTPTEVIVDPEDTTVHIYYKRYKVAENPSINRLAVVVKNAEVRFVLTFYGHTGRRLKGETKTKRATYLKR